MELTAKQKQGLNIILERYRNHEKYTTIAGYAGTGKSTLIKFAIEALNIEPYKIAYATYTGKAAEVLRKKGNPGACTLHKLLYESIPLSGGGFYRRPKTFLGVDIVVVDEISMVPKFLIDQLLLHRVYVIFLGDPFQLPQIDKGEDNHILDNPHIFLDEIMRQAEESEIIQLTMKIREGKNIPLFHGQDVQVLSAADLNTGMLSWADQIICATNKTRISINNLMRTSYGFEGLPKDGEKMICLRNYWDKSNENEDALVNGTTGIIRNPFESFREIPRTIKNDRYRLPIIIGNFQTDSGEFNSLELDKEMILTGKKCIDWKVSFQLGKMKNKIGDIVPLEFAFAYAITGHKSQGSEYEKVLVIEENFPFDKKEHARWLYTCCTRASEKLVLVRNQ